MKKLSAALFAVTTLLTGNALAEKPPISASPIDPAISAQLALLAGNPRPLVEYILKTQQSIECNTADPHPSNICQEIIAQIDGKMPDLRGTHYSTRIENTPENTIRQTVTTQPNQ